MMHDEPRGKDQAGKLETHEGEPRAGREKFRQRVHLHAAFADAFKDAADAAGLDGFQPVRAGDGQHLQHFADAGVHLLRLHAHGLVLLLEPAIKQFQQGHPRRHGDEKIQRQQRLFDQRDDRHVGDDQQAVQARVHEMAAEAVNGVHVPQ